MAEFSAMEPTLNKDLPALVSAAKKTGFEVIHVISNGIRFQDPVFAKAILNAGANKVTISLHSADEKQEAYLSQNPSAFEQKIQALLNLKALQKQHSLMLSVTTVVTKLSLAQMVPLIKLVARLGVKHVNMYFPRITGNAKKNFTKVIPRFGALRKELPKARAAAAQHAVVLTFVDIPPCIYYDYDDPELYGRRLRKQVIGIQEKSSRLKEKSNGLTLMRSFGPRCPSCAFYAECDGVEKEYTKVFGWGEFKPVNLKRSSLSNNSFKDTE